MRLWTPGSRLDEPGNDDEGTRRKHVRVAERGLPRAMRSDNGLPFARPNGLYNLSRLSVWWLN